MIATSLVDLWHGFGVALEPHNLMYCVIGVLIGQVVGVLPGMGAMAAISLLLPLTFVMKPVAAILMLSGIFYGSQYGGAICSILLNLPCHPPHAVTCLDGYPLTQQGKGGTALMITMIGSFIGASFGITEMVFFAPVLTHVALEFGPSDICAIMFLGLIAGSTLAKGSPVKGIAMTLLGLLLGMVGSDINTGTPRFTFGITELLDGVQIVALALGMFGIAEFLKNINRLTHINTSGIKLSYRDMRPSRADLKAARMPWIRGTLIGSLCSLIPGTGPTIASFVAYATEKRISKTPERFGHGAIEGVASPEASTHSSVQGDFIPTMSLGIPGDSVMALLLGALMIQGITPGPQLIVQHPDIFWGLIASFWVGNIILVFLNIPLIGLWVRLLSVPYRHLYPAALFFICIGVYGANNSFFEVGETLVIGIVGYVFLLLDFHPASILLGFVLGPRVEENFRRAMVFSDGDLRVFIERPISAVFVGLSVLLLLTQLFLWLRRSRRAKPVAVAIVAVVFGIALMPAVGFAQSWPTQPVTLIVPYGPGASNDVFTRALADALSRRLGKPFIVDNRPGAGGFTGVNAVSRASASGYTLVEVPNSVVAFKPIMNVDIDPLKNLTPIAVMATSPTALVVNARLPVHSVAEFVAYAKANPDKLFYGYAGTGTTQQQHMEMFNQLTGTRIKGVNYKSSADAQTDLLAGRLQAMFVTVASTLGQIESGDLRLLAYTDANHPDDAPKAPTMAEAGVPGMQKAQIWWGMFGPPGMAPALVASINAAINDAIGDPSFEAVLAKSGTTPRRASPAQFVAMIKDETALVDDLARLLAVKK